MPGKSRREYVSFADRVGQQREARVGLWRRLKLVPPQPPPPPPPVRIELPNWNSAVYVHRLTEGEFADYAAPWPAFTYSVTGATTAYDLRLLNTSIGTTSTSTITLNGTWNTMGTPITMQPGTIVNADYPTPQVRHTYAPPTPRTPEELAANAARRLRQQEQREEAHRRRITAQDRARATLLEFLTPEQRADYAQYEYFYVEGSAGNLYRIDLGNAGNVMYCDRATLRPLGSICAHPSMAEHWLPNQDVQLAQKLALEFDEPGFTAIANVHWGIRPPNADLTRRGGPTPADARLHVAGPQPLIAA
jgi:hypothetical protein